MISVILRRVQPTTSESTDALSHGGMEKQEPAAESGFGISMPSSFAERKSEVISSSGPSNHSLLSNVLISIFLIAGSSERKFGLQAAGMAAWSLP